MYSLIIPSVLPELTLMTDSPIYLLTLLGTVVALDHRTIVIDNAVHVRSQPILT